MNEAQIRKILNRHAVMLREHFESVQIVVTKETPEGTQHGSWGSGNWYARYGSVRWWLTKEEGDASELGSIQRRELEDEENEDPE